MILSLLAIVAVLAALAVIAAALVLAEPNLVYIALGLGGLSVLLLLGAMVQGRSSGARPDTESDAERTDGLGKSSVPVMAAAAAGTVAAPRWEPEESGRVPAPAEQPVRESAPSEQRVERVAEHPVSPGHPAPVSEPRPAAAEESEEETEFEVPRWQTPTSGNWPEAVAEPDSEPEAATGEPAGAELPEAEPVAARSEPAGADAPAEGAEERAEAESSPEPEAEAAPEPEREEAPAEAFSYRIPDQAAREDREEASVGDTDHEEPPQEGEDPGTDVEGLREAPTEEEPAEEAVEAAETPEAAEDSETDPDSGNGVRRKRRADQNPRQWSRESAIEGAIDVAVAIYIESREGLVLGLGRDQYGDVAYCRRRRARSARRDREREGRCDCRRDKSLEFHRLAPRVALSLSKDQDI